ncbi:MAG: single-stranded DNA-binding protein, partial [Acidobacteriota bacterium]
FTLATNERYFNPTTKESDVRTEWHRIVAWGKLAEFCEKFLNQGKQIYLEGKIKTRSWEDRDGNKRYTTEVIAQNIVFLGRKDDSSAETSFPDETAEESKEEEAPQNQSDNEEDIPF